MTFHSTHDKFSFKQHSSKSVRFPFKSVLWSRSRNESHHFPCWGRSHIKKLNFKCILHYISHRKGVGAGAEAETETYI
jgi:hypothetical protein